jgi:Flp pilus assembly protein TadG
MAAVMNLHTHRPSRVGERGQAIIMFVGIITIIFVIAAMVIDFGLWFAERRAAQRAADLAAMAGSQDLAYEEDDAFANACRWAVNNGFEEDEVTVDVFADSDAVSQWSAKCSESGPPASFECSPPCDTIRVSVKRPASRLFTSIFNVAAFDVTAVASAGQAGNGGGAGQPTGDTTLDAVFLLDASASMYTLSCNHNQDNDACPFKHARDAVNGLVDLVPGGAQQVGGMGYIPFNYCYDPPRHDGIYCLDESLVVAPTNDQNALHAAVNATRAGSSTNICMPLLRAKEMLQTLPEPGHRWAVVLLSDGDNNDFINVEEITLYDYPPASCRPQVARLDWRTRACGEEATQEKEEDLLTWRRAEELKAIADIYVIALDVCGNDDGKTRNSPGYCAGMANTEAAVHDNVADQRLLKCIASSPDHYYRVASAHDLPDVYRQIAFQIAPRTLEGD